MQPAIFWIYLQLCPKKSYVGFYKDYISFEKFRIIQKPRWKRNFKVTFTCSPAFLKSTNS